MEVVVRLEWNDVVAFIEKGLREKGVWKEGDSAAVVKAIRNRTTDKEISIEVRLEGKPTEH